MNHKSIFENCNLNINEKLDVIEYLTRKSLLDSLNELTTDIIRIEQDSNKKYFMDLDIELIIKVTTTIENKIAMLLEGLTEEGKEALMLIYDS